LNYLKATTITVNKAVEFQGGRLNTDLPRKVYTLMRLYKMKAPFKRSSVEFLITSISTASNYLQGRLTLRIIILEVYGAR